MTDNGMTATDSRHDGEPSHVQRLHDASTDQSGGRAETNERAQADEQTGTRTGEGSRGTALDSLSESKARLLELLLRKKAGAAQQITPAVRERSGGFVQFPLSGSQERLWFIDQLEGNTRAYQIPAVIRLRGGLNRAALRAALDALIRRHETLRTIFINVGGEPVQRVLPARTFDLHFVQVKADTAHEQEQESRRQLRALLGEAGDLRVGPLIRGRLLQMTQNEHVLLLIMHHIVSDGLSIGVLIRELAALYDAHVQGRSDPLAPLAIQYADYVQWHRQWLAGDEACEQLAYWTEHLQGAPELLALPVDRPRPATQSYQGANAPISIDANLVMQLWQLARSHNGTMAMVLFTAWSIVLSRLSGHEDLVIGMPIANRRRVETEGLIGFLVNTLAVRVQMDGDPTVAELLRQVKDTMLGAYANQDCPFERVVDALRPARSLSYSPLFQAMFVFQNAAQSVGGAGELTIEEQPVPAHAAHFDVTLSLSESAGRIDGNLNYATDLFDAATIERWAGYFERVLSWMVSQPQIKVGMLPLMSEHEHRQIVETFNATRTDFRATMLIHELFEEQAVRAADEIAVAAEECSLTYAQLNVRANQLAWYLREKGIGPDRLVGVCSERKVELIVALLAVLKAGGAYVPLDPSNPPERLAHILTDASPPILLTLEGLKQSLPQTAAEIVTLDGDWPQIERCNRHNPGARSVGLSPAHLAYVIYTSGSTGRPKGVMIEHRNLANYSLHISRQFDIAAGGGSLICTSLSYDLGLTGLYPVLLSGRTVRLCAEQHGLPALAEEILQSRNLAPLKLTPSHLTLLDGLLRQGKLADRVSALVLGGEPLQGSLVRLWKANAPNTRIFNHYGPTETTIGCIVNELTEDVSGPVPIGRPISNVRAYVLDRRGQPVPIGVTGEIYIGGAGVGRGYLHRPELTTERFIQDPFSNGKDTRLYKTGDLGCWRADGVLEYLGRNDDQVKIRGFRIELGEIAAQLKGCHGIAEAVAIAREDYPGEKRLVAYVVPSDPAEPLNIEDLRKHLRTGLPEYMLPSAIVVMAGLPLTANGKLDRRALPEPHGEVYRRGEYQPPEGEIETSLAEIWQKLLRVKRVARQDNFFELGGHSLLVVQMMEHLRRIGLTVELRRIFECPTLADLAAAVTREGATQLEVPPNRIPPDCEMITPEQLPLLELRAEQIDRIVGSVAGGAKNVQDIYPLVPLQEGILFHHLLNEGKSDTYVSSIVLSVCSQQRLDELIAAVQAVIDRHDVLRTAVLWEELPQPVQVVYRRATLSIEEIALDPHRDVARQIEEMTTRERQWLDLHCAPLLRLRVAADPNSEMRYAVLQRHHIICDHVTLEILVTEIVAYLQGRGGSLPRAGVPYRQHVAQALRYAQAHDAQAFFRSRLGDIHEPTAPFGLLDVHGDGTQISEAHRTLEPELAQRVRVEARRLGMSPAAIFHAAWALVVAHTSGRDDVVFGSVLLGRMQGTAGTERMLGLFINTLPLRLRIRDVSVKDLVQQTRAELVELLNHEQASLAAAQRCSGIVGSAPLFTSLLNYRHSAPNPDAEWTAASGINVLASRERTNYPIAMSVDDLGAGFSLKAQTDSRIDPKRVTAYLHAALRSLLDALNDAPQSAALALAIMPPSERRRVIELFNSTEASYSRDRLIHKLFEDQVERSPEAVALTDEMHAITYRDLNARANRLARYLRERGVMAGERVPILLSRSVQMIVAQLAVLKSGGVYVPLDPEWPTQRLRFILGDCGARTVITEGPPPADLAAEVANWIDCTGQFDSMANEEWHDVPGESGAVTPAYVMYTSGSTGAPKGVIVPHHAVANLVINNRYAQIGEDDCIAHDSNPAFDASTFEVWGALLNGARLLVVPQSIVLEVARFASVLQQHRVTVLFISVGLFTQYAASMGHVFKQLRYLITGGDRLEPSIVREVLAKSPPQHFINAYGPTECTTFATTHEVASVGEEDTNIPIGRPISNARIYIFGPDRQPVPIGVAGEIYIGGAGVACGYLNRPELTAERFIPDPYSADPQARLYKTGDLSRWRDDGTIEFLGRNDHQIKMRGFRIELGEIEAQLASHPVVMEAVVVAQADSTHEKRLVAYVVPRAASNPPAITAEQLRTELSQTLPQYMVPSAFVVLERMPLTPNGKIDRRSLPAPQSGAYAQRHYEPPEGETERMLAAIWGELLQVDRVGRDDDFFELGGHSLLVLKLLSRVGESLGFKVKVTDIYRNPTVRDLARLIGGDAAQEAFVNLSSEAVLADDIVAHRGSRRIPEQAIMLTGGTGFVGRFLLAQLLRDTSAQVYCLVRARSQEQGLARLRTTLAVWDLWREDFEERIVAVPADLRAPRLGLDSAAYETLCRSVDTIYHCATSMNHLETYAMAKPANVAAAGELLRLATEHRPKLVNYVSTLSVFSSLTAEVPRTVDELSTIDGEKHPGSGGYSASKWVGEKIFLAANERGIPCNIFRLGLVWADTILGRYDELQREYRILKSCLLSGCGIRGYRYDMPPTPVDYVARAMIGLSQAHRSGGGVFHIASRDQTIEDVFERCNEIAGTSLRLVSYYDWICHMKRLHEAGYSAPIVPLIEFAFSLDERSFEEHRRNSRSARLRFECARTHAELQTLGIVAPKLSDELLGRCLQSMLARDADLRQSTDLAVMNRAENPARYRTVSAG